MIAKSSVNAVWAIVSEAAPLVVASMTAVAWGGRMRRGTLMVSFTRDRVPPRVLGPAARLVALFGAACVLVGWQAGTAFAGIDAFMGNQGLSAGNAYASASAHSGVDLIDGLADHTHCPTYATGYSGYTSTLNGGGNFTALSGPCGPGYQQYPVSIGSFVRGAERNPNASTFDQFSWANLWW